LVQAVQAESVPAESVQPEVVQAASVQPEVVREGAGWLPPAQGAQ
jgi:hypothetical protein